MPASLERRQKHAANLARRDWSCVSSERGEFDPTRAPREALRPLKMEPSEIDYLSPPRKYLLPRRRVAVSLCAKPPPAMASPRWSSQMRCGELSTSPS